MKLNSLCFLQIIVLLHQVKVRADVRLRQALTDTKVFTYLLKNLPCFVLYSILVIIFIVKNVIVVFINQWHFIINLILIFDKK